VLFAGPRQNCRYCRAVLLASPAAGTNPRSHCTPELSASTSTASTRSRRSPNSNASRPARPLT